MVKKLWVFGNGTIRFLLENSLFLIGGSIVALLWANFANTDYEHFVHAAAVTALPAMTTHFLVNDVFMALFFAIAAKEVWESFLPGGSLNPVKNAVTPLMATLGGVVMPAVIYLLLVAMAGRMSDLGRGWAVPCATDIAFSYLVARFIFGKGHPAISFLLLLAIVDDAAGLAILTVAYPQHALHPVWWLLIGAAIGLGVLFNKKLRLKSFWWYLLIPGIMSWVGFYMSGLHAALALVPIIPTLPHAKRDIGLFAEEEMEQHDTLNEFEHWWKNPVELILGLFGLVNAGVLLSNVGVATWIVLAGLLIGKPLGILLFTWIGVHFFRLSLPKGMDFRQVVVVGMVAGIGFTVALFVTTAAFTQPGLVQDAVKMGALGSFAAAGLSLLMARLLGIKPVGVPEAVQEPEVASELVPVESN